MRKLLTTIRRDSYNEVDIVGAMAFGAAIGLGHSYYAVLIVAVRFVVNVVLGTLGYKRGNIGSEPVDEQRGKRG